MEYRLANKIDPNKVFAPEDIKIFRKQKDEFNLHRYTDKELLRLFNEVAENKQETNSVPMAQNGAVLKADKGVKTRKDF